MSNERLTPATVWTDEQRLAIDLSGGNVLVTAAAGSGKTSVLTERLKERVIAGNDIRKYVVVTFTKAAAAEMKARLGKKLNDYVRENPEDRAVKYQLMYINEANISTIDAFCLSLLERYQSSPKVDYVPGVRIISEGEQSLLFKKALNEALEDEYAKGEAEFVALLDAMSDSRGGDSDLKKAIKKLNDIAGAVPDFGDLRGQMLLNLANVYGEYDDNGIIQNAFDDLAGACRVCIEGVEALVSRAPDKTVVKSIEAHTDYLKRTAEFASALLGSALAKDAEACYEAIKRQREEMPHAVKFDGDWFEKRKELRGRFYARIDRLADYFLSSRERFEEEKTLLPVIAERLFAVYENAAGKYAELKKDRGVWDFADIERKAVRLLWDRGEDGSWIRTQVSLEEGRRYEEILIDEYQDVNEMQERIFRGVCNENEDNIFMVGDVKQAIYGFRNATPELFIKHRDNYTPAFTEDAEFPAKISLNVNFRSRQEITDAVNAVFNAVMTKSFCGIDYTEDELRHDPNTADAENPCAGAYFSPVDGDLKDEAEYVAAKIKEIIGSGMTVANGREGGRRGIEYRDFAVLMRSFKRGKGRVFAKAFEDAGIPYSLQDNDGFVNVPSARKMISVLRAIDNPMKDVDVAAAMHSPVFGFTESELVRIRRAKSGVFYYAVKAAAEAGDAKAAAFVEKLERYRRKSATLTAEKLIWYIYSESGYPAFAMTLKNGRRERDALMSLFECAKSFGSSGRRDLSGFVSYVNRIIEEGEDLEGAVSSASENVVKMMTMHKSKGLEFPVCFVCGTKSPFNISDSTETYVIDSQEKLLGLKIAKPSEHKKSDTLARKQAAAAVEAKHKRESMRLLYVAMTRAGERLEVVASMKNVNKKRGEMVARLDAAGHMDEETVSSATSMFDWIAPVAYCSGAFAIGGTASPAPAASPEPEALPAPEPDEALAGRILERINSRYEYSDSAAVPTKLTVSDIVAMKAGREEDERCCERRPACLDAFKRGGAEAGTATHAFLQFADFAKLGEPESELKRLVDARFITEKQAELVDRRKLANFASSDIFRRICASDEVTREFRFTFEADASDFVPGAPREKLLVQGAIDCFFIEDGKCVIVDYKTDRIKDNIAEKAAYYKPQLEIYARGLKELTGREVSEAVLYFLDANEEVRVI
ncbi:MAG: UvrD-helicase domain-containing protein [Clostridia bacterium]|nr:UvrD-helicase domain-containing protein [Clostridia bacterium]